jgi:hypothetical protein
MYDRSWKYDIAVDTNQLKKNIEHFEQYLDQFIRM